MSTNSEQNRGKLTIERHVKPFMWFKSPSFVDRLTTDIILELFNIMYEAGYNIRAMGTTCRRWRDVYLNTSRFWSHVKLFMEKLNPQWDSETFRRINFDRLSALGRRSGRRRLTVDLECGRGISSRVMRTVLNQFPIFINVFPLATWSKVLLGSNSQVQYALIKYTPYLCSLKHVVASMYTTAVSAFLAALSQGSNRLRTLEFKEEERLGVHVHRPWPLPLHMESWPQLLHQDSVLISRPPVRWGDENPITTLQTYFIAGRWPTTPNRWITNLALCKSVLTSEFQPHLQFPNLERFRAYDLKHTQPLGEISFPTLKHLEVHGEPICLLVHISAPQIETLTISSSLESIKHMVTPGTTQNGQAGVIPIHLLLYQSPKLEHLSIDISSSAECPLPTLEALYDLIGRPTGDRKRASLVCKYLNRLSIRLCSVASIGDQGSVRKLTQTLIDAHQRLEEVLVGWIDGSVVEVRK